MDNKKIFSEGCADTVLVLGYFLRKKIVLAMHALFIVVTIFFFSNNVFAAAGDLIGNTATISYDIGGNSVTTNAVNSFAEDRRINFIVAEADGAVVPVISNMIDAVMQFTVTNSGNDVHDFLLTAVNTSPNPFGPLVDSFDPVPLSIQVFVESGVTPGYQVAQDTVAFVDELLAGTSTVVYVIADMPAVVADDVAAITLIAQVAEGGTASTEGVAINADDNSQVSPAGQYSNGTTNVVAGTPTTSVDTASMETVFNDPAGAAAEDVSSNLAQDISGNGQHVDSGAFQVVSPVVLTKSLTVIDTLGGSDPHPGATLRYQIDVTVSGNSAISNLIITDLIPVNTTYVDGSILLNGVAQTDVVDAPADYTRAIDILSKPVLSVEVDLSQAGTVTVAPGSTNTIIFDVTID